MAQKQTGKIARDISRPPIVAVLGHVDHGKTTLISKILEQDLTKKESGGISQHIGAYQINFKDQKITLIDTPGHVAFSQMRSRGARVADLIVLVVAADEGVKPQTLECLKHIQESQVPFLVAINKIDLPNVNLDQVKKDLAKNGVLLEGYGGEVVTVPVSALTGQGVDELLEMILLLAQMAEIKGDPTASLEAVVIESKLDAQKGVVATVLVRNGSLFLTDQVKVDQVTAKVKAMTDDRGKPVKQAEPGQPVKILGFKQVPPIGSLLEKASSADQPVEVEEVASIEPVGEQAAETETEKIKIILKTDVVGTQEAILSSLPEEVQVVFSGIGNVSESDILLASTTEAPIFAFNVKVPGQVKKLATTEGVEIKNFRVIYELLEELEKLVLKILEPTIDEEVLGEAEVLAEFEIKAEKIAGCRVKKGQISQVNPVHLRRNKKIVGEAKIKSMKTGKAVINQVGQGEEFGVVFVNPLDFKIGDMLVSYRPLPK